MNRKIVLVISISVLLIPLILMILNVQAVDRPIDYSSDEVVCASILIPPTIDGYIDETEWVEANVYTNVGMNDLFWIYAAHDYEFFYLGIKISTDNLYFEEDCLEIFFDEGDDGLYGSGSFDRVLKSNQEDWKIIRYGFPPLEDGYYVGKDGWVWHATEMVPLDFGASKAFYEDRHEFELKIPFQGVENRSWVYKGTEYGDLSDVNCTSTDIIGMLIEFRDQREPPYGGTIYSFPSHYRYAMVSFERPAPVITASIDIDPDTLNLKSKGKWITCYIELPEDHSASDIGVSTVRLNGEIPAELHPTGIGDYDSDGITDLMVKFDRQEVIALLNVGEATLTMTGQVNGITFEGSDTIRVIGK